MPKCTYCGADIPAGERYCPVCRAAIPPKYDEKTGSYSGTYGHDDCWEVDESRYRRFDYPDSAGSAPRTAAPLREWKPSPSAAAKERKSPEKKTPSRSKELRNISLLLTILTWILNPFGYVPLILAVIGTVLEHRGINGKPLYICSLVLSLGFVLYLFFLMFTGGIPQMLDILMP